MNAIVNKQYSLAIILVLSEFVDERMLSVDNIYLQAIVV